MIKLIFVIVCICLQQTSLALRSESLKIKSQEDFDAKIKNFVEMAKEEKIESLSIQADHVFLENIVALNLLENLTDFLHLKFSLTENQISDLTPLNKCLQNQKKLITFDLNIRNNKISDLQPFKNLLKNCEKLEELSIALSNNRFEINFEALGNMGNLPNLQKSEFYFKECDLQSDELSFLPGFINSIQNSPFIKLEFQENEISDLKQFKNIQNLNFVRTLDINLKQNLITDIEEFSQYLQQMTLINYLDLNMDQNEISSLLPLKDIFIKLSKLNVVTINIKDQKDQKVMCDLNYITTDSQSNYVVFEETSCPKKQCGSSKCKFCWAQENQCTSCLKQKYLENEQCVTQCAENMIAYNGIKCLDTCPQNTYQKIDKDSSQKFCEKCDSIFCAECDNSGICTKCAKGFQISLKGECYPQCYANCQKCDNQLKCSKCEGNMVLHQNSCLMGCPSGYISENGYCISQKCSQGMFESDNGVCIDCNPTCYSCRGTKASQCIMCNPGFEWNKYQSEEEKICIEKEDVNIQEGVEELGFWETIFIFFGLLIGTGVMLFCCRKYLKKKDIETESLLNKRAQSDKYIESELANTKNFDRSDTQDSSVSQVQVQNEISIQISPEKNNNGAKNGNTGSKPGSAQKVPSFNELSAGSSGKVKSSSSLDEELQYITNDAFNLKYKKLSILSQGQYGIVDKYLEIISGREVAIKKYNYVDDPQLLKEGLKEVELLKTLNSHCSNVIEFLNCFIIRQQPQDEQEQSQNGKSKTHLLAIVMELAEYSLHDVLQKNKEQNKKMSQNEVQQLLKDVSSVFTVSHNTLRVSHLDINPKNILYKNGTWRVYNWMSAKSVSQFASSKKIVEDKPKSLLKMPYLSPEQRENQTLMLQNKLARPKPFDPFLSDIFSFGICMYEVLTLKTVDGVNESKNMLENALVENLMSIQGMDIGIVGSVTAMLVWDPSQRISFQQLNQRYT